MAGDSFNIGLSALVASQQALATTGHNIANVNTPGYSRQVVSFVARQPQFVGNGFAGKGVDVQAINRMANQFLTDQVRISTANQAQADKTVELVDQVDNQIGAALIPDSLQSFFSSISDANNDPSTMATRQVAIERAHATITQFAEEENQLNGLSRNVNREIVNSIGQVNALTTVIAKVNNDIALSAGLASGQPANDLLDKRDQLLVDLSKLVSVQTQIRGDGMVNVLVGDGQLVVTGNNSEALQATANVLDASRTEIAFKVGGALTQITAGISGGALGALITFRDHTLEPAHNAVGRLAATFAMEVNAQHRKGMDLNGALGSDLFAVPPPVVNSSSTNAGTVSVTFDTSNVGALTTADYNLTNNGANFILARTDDGTSTTLSGAGPFNIDGMIISVTSAPASGDQYLIQPTKTVPRGLTMLTSNPARLALALPVQTLRATANVGSATISRGQILDESNPALLTTTQIVFNNPPTTYQINGLGPTLPYTAGGDIDVNGWRVQINGQPVTGDSFTVRSNFGGKGDNANGLALAQLQSKTVLAGGTASLQDAYGMITGQVGADASQAHISSKALATLTANASAARDTLSGVNLEEEAANLLRYQQAFQAAAQVIKAADTAFQALINATRG